MRSGERQSLADLVAREHDGLSRLANLLEGDRAAADALVRTALVAAATRRRPFPRSPRDPGDDARRALVRRHTGRSGTSSGWVAEPDPWSPEGDPLRRALDDLPPRSRAAVVLHVYEGRSDDDIARLLGTAPASVRTDVAEALHRLQAALSLDAALLGGSRRAPSVAVDAQAELRRELALLAEPAPPLPGAPDTGDDVVREAVGRRRRRWLIAVSAAALTCGAAVAVVVAGGSPPEPSAAPADRSAEPSRSTDEPLPATDFGAPLPIDVFGDTTRGSLGGDEDFVAAVRELPWEREEWGIWTDTPLPLESRRVVFAGDVPGGRWALVLGSISLQEREQLPGPDGMTESVMAWFVGPPGAAPDEMSIRTYPVPIYGGNLPALLDPRTGALVVIPLPGQSVEVSLAPVIAADGSASRSYEPVEVVDGVASTRVPVSDVPWTAALLYRVLQDGREVARSWPNTVEELATYQGGMPDVGPLPLDDVEFLRGSAAGGTPDPVTDTLSQILAQVGLPPSEVDATAHWVGDVPGPERAARAALVTVRVPSGALVVGMQWALAGTDGSMVGGPCGLDIRPAGAPAEERVYAGQCEVFDWSQPEAELPELTLVVVAPPSVSKVRLYSAGGDYLGEHETTDGVVIAPVPPSLASVQGVTDGGVLLGRVPLLDPYTDFGS